MTPKLLSLYETCGDTLLCQSVFCAPCLYGSIAKVLTQEESWFGNKPFCAALAWISLSPLGLLTNWACVSPVHLQARRIFVKESNVDETAWTSCLTVVCCTPCSLSQIQRQFNVTRPVPLADDATQAAFQGAPPQTMKMYKTSSQVLAHPKRFTIPSDYVIKL